VKEAESMKGKSSVAVLFLLALWSMPCVGQEAADVLERVRPAVLTITTADSNGKGLGFGSGFIVQANGVVITAWHVVSGAASAKVKLADGRTIMVLGLLGSDPVKDYALLKVDAAGLPTLIVGDSDKMRQGDKVYTLGSPEGLEQTASEGIVSAVRTDAAAGRLIQTTAPVSHGNSGGPLLNAQGQAVGVVLFKLVNGQALNFALAINQVNITANALAVIPFVDPASSAVPTKPATLTLVLPPSKQATKLRAHKFAFVHGSEVGRLGKMKLKSKIYQSPNIHSRVLTSITAGTYVAAEGIEGAWYAVLMKDGSTGWVLKNAVKLLSYVVTNVK
jgi:S1-C subfamily serine protease